MSDPYAVTPPDAVVPAAIPRPPLDRRQVRGSLIAGAVSFSVIGLGSNLFAVPIAIGLVVALLRGIAGIAVRFSDDDAGIRPFIDAVRSFDLGPWVALLVLASLAGVALMVGGMFASRAILRAHGIARPWAVSWAGLGIAVAAGSVVGGGFSSTFGSGGVPGAGPDADTVRAVVTVLAVLATVVSIVVNAAIGGASWWWMAIALRPRAATEQTTTPGTTTEEATTPGTTTAGAAPVEETTAGQ